MKQLEDRCNECRQSMVSVENKYEQCGTIHSKADDLQHAMNALERNTSEALQALHTKANDVLSAQMSFASSKQDELQAIENAKGAVEAFTLASNSGDYVSTPLTILKHKLSATKLVGIAATLTHAKADLASAKAEAEVDLSRVEEARDESLRKFATCESEAKDLSTTAQKICRPAEGVGAEHE